MDYPTTRLSVAHFGGQVSLLHANVVLGAPLSVIEILYENEAEQWWGMMMKKNGNTDDDNPSSNLDNRLATNPPYRSTTTASSSTKKKKSDEGAAIKTVDLLIDALDKGSDGVFTFLVNKIKSKCDNGADQQQWKVFLDVMKDTFLKSPPDSNNGEYYKFWNIMLKISFDKLDEFMESFPEFITIKRPVDDVTFRSPLEHCFLSREYNNNGGGGDDSSNRLKYHANRIVGNPDMDLFFNVMPNRLLPTNCAVMDPNRLDALTVVLTKVHRFHFFYDRDQFWDATNFSIFLRQLFQSTTTVKKLKWCVRNWPGARSSFSLTPESIHRILTSLSEETDMNCPIEEISVSTCNNTTDSLLPFLRPMHHLKVLKVTRHGDETDIGDGEDWNCIGDVVAQGRLESLHINTEFFACPNSVLHILDSAASNNPNLKEIHMQFCASNKLHIQCLQERMVEILQQRGNTTLTKVMIYSEETCQSAFAHKIRYLSLMNRYGRGGIRHGTINKHWLLRLLNSIDKHENVERLGLENEEDHHDGNGDHEEQQQQGELVTANLKTSLLYGLLRERPDIWTPRQQQIHSNTDTSSISTTTTNTNTVLKQRKRKRGIE